MKKIVAKIDFGLNGEYYEQGKEINNLNYNQIVKLNEMGYIEPLDFKDLLTIKKELEQPKIFKKEEN